MKYGQSKGMWTTGSFLPLWKHSLRNIAEVQKGGDLRNSVPEFIPIFKAVSARAWTEISVS